MSTAEDLAREVEAINRYHAARVRQLRMSRGWSQRDLAARLEPPAAQSSINEWESAEHALSTKTMARLCLAFGMSIAEAFGVTWEPVDR